MNRFITLLFIAIFMFSCNNSNTGEKTPETTSTETSQTSSDYDLVKGEGKFQNVELAATLDHSLANLGETVVGTKCVACHKLTDERLVGPGWAGVTERRSPEWIMNFITNPDPMIDKDPELQAQLEICLVRMPNQNVTDEEARQILEFMRKNDGVQ